MPVPRPSDPRGTRHPDRAGRAGRGGRFGPAGRDATPRPLSLTAAWAGVASALVAAVVVVAGVAVVWLPASGGSGSAGSAIRAGALTFLAAVHGGVTVDGLPTSFVPLGLTALAAVFVWRAATAVAGAAEEAGENRPVALLVALATQCGSFAVTCALLAAASTLGSSSASVPGAFVAGFVLSAVIAGPALLRHSALGDGLVAVVPPWLITAARVAGATLAVHLSAGALLVGGALVLHHDRVTALSHEVGGGWSGVPVLLLGVLAAPNATVAGAGYLSGAGFAVGTGTTAGLTGTTTGLVPAFPVLGALPTGDGAAAPVWILAAVTPLAAGACLAALAGRATTPSQRWRDAAGAVAGVAVLGAAVAWLAGGGVGTARLQTLGVPPLRFGLLLALWTGAVAAALLAARAAVAALRRHEGPQRPGLRATFAALASVEQYDDADSDDDIDDIDDTDTDHEDDANGATDPAAAAGAGRTAPRRGDGEAQGERREGTARGRGRGDLAG
ncbi:hypothetical protein SAMN05443575_1135 [Jatrophihabitans endophyticus]|uniref:Uncharacterized protein n=1 Tax=Jatrophihabitans endophyticus TaxID=1206085 RepID=A0A1M5GD26_9ACTN|nr:DUF6350 family protein [Jatrophihabitans endophyticus]SHG01633.1 hypothetical protein SAMN05443575_1135 [Jatrophihabitans endophyticus]